MNKGFNKKFHIGLILLSFFFLTGFKVDTSPAKSLEALPKTNYTAKVFKEEPNCFVFSYDGGNYEAMDFSHPIYVENGRTLVHFEDALRLVPMDKLVYNEESGVLAILQIKRTYMALDKNAYIEQNKLHPSNVSPKRINEELYVPLRFVLEKFGYRVKYNTYQNELLIIPEDNREEEIIPIDRIRMTPFSNQTENLEIIRTYDLDGKSLLGLGTSREKKDYRMVRLNSRGKVFASKNFYRGDFEGLYDGETKEYYLSKGISIQILDLVRGLSKTVGLPQMLHEGKLMDVHEGWIYIYKGNSIYRYDFSTKKVEKILDQEGIKKLRVEGDYMYIAEEGRMSTYSIKEKEFRLLNPDYENHAMDIIGIQSPYIVLYDKERFLLKAYNLQTGQRVINEPFVMDKNTTIQLSNGAYLAAGQGRDLYLYQLNTGQVKSLDLTNLRQDINRGNIRWFWDGTSLLGHWEYNLLLDTQILDQLITIRF